MNRLSCWSTTPSPSSPVPSDGRQREFDGLIAEGVGVVQTLITHGIHFLVDSGEAFDDPIGA